MPQSHVVKGNHSLPLFSFHVQEKSWTLIYKNILFDLWDIHPVQWDNDLSWYKIFSVLFNTMIAFRYCSALNMQTDILALSGGGRVSGVKEVFNLAKGIFIWRSKRKIQQAWFCLGEFFPPRSKMMSVRHFKILFHHSHHSFSFFFNFTSCLIYDCVSTTKV